NKKVVGGLIVRNFNANNAPRKKITIGKSATAGFAGNILITSSSAKVSFFAADAGGAALAQDGTQNKFANAALPKDLFVEGVTESATMRDIEIAINADGGAAMDTAKLTVLWVDQPTVALAGNISPKNAKKAGYKSWTKSGKDDLGLQEYNAKFGARMGW